MTPQPTNKPCTISDQLSTVYDVHHQLSTSQFRTEEEIYNNCITGFILLINIMETTPQECFTEDEVSLIIETHQLVNQHLREMYNLDSPE